MKRLFPPLRNKLMKSFVAQNVMPYFVSQYSTMTAPGGGGGGGSIRKAGGAFERRGRAKEDQYFHKHNIKTLEKLKERLDYHEQEIKEHEIAIEKVKREQADIDKEHK